MPIPLDGFVVCGVGKKNVSNISFHQNFGSIAIEWPAYLLWVDAVRRRQKPFCVDPTAEKHPERNQRLTTSTVEFGPVYPVKGQRTVKPSSYDSFFIPESHLDGRRRNAKIKFVFLLDTSFDQLLNGILFLRKKRRREQMSNNEATHWKAD